VSHYQRLGGRVDPTDEGVAMIFGDFVGATICGSADPNFRIYYRETPETHAEQAISIYSVSD
jgi:3-oxoacyl-[acyl-carrier-protein] synthase III